MSSSTDIESVRYSSLVPKGRRYITLVLADDHAVVRKGIRDFFEDDDDLRVMAEASDGDQALALISAHKPNVAVLDIQMPNKTGLEVTRLLRESGYKSGILILTAYDDEPFVKRALLAGANGYVLKTAEPEELVQAVRDVYEGQSVFDARLGGIGVTAALTSVSLELARNAADGSDTLSRRETEVLQLVAQGYTNKAIAAQLDISDRTVQGHLANIFGKFGAQSRTECVMIGLRLGLIAVSGQK